jgi:hypothetical protein
MNEAKNINNPTKKAWSIGVVVARFFRCWFEREPNAFAPRLGLVLLPTQRFSERYKHLLSLNMYGFRKHKELYPYRNKMLIEVEILYMNFCFRIGIQNKTWFSIQWVEGAIWWHKFRRKYLERSGDGLPF